MSGARYEPLSQAEDNPRAHKDAHSLPLYELRSSHSTRHAHDVSSSSDEEDEEERMKLQEGDMFLEELDDDDPQSHKHSVSVHPARPELCLLTLMTGSALEPCGISCGV